MNETVETNRPEMGRRRFRAEHRNGGLVEMSDNSQWEISPGHEIFTIHWDEDATIIVVPGGFPEYPFDLINSANGDRVPARYSGPSRTATGWQLTDH